MRYPPLHSPKILPRDPNGNLYYRANNGEWMVLLPTSRFSTGGTPLLVHVVTRLSHRA